MTGLPLGFLVVHRYDNIQRLQDMAKRGGKVWLLHGAEDEVIPVQMGRILSKTMPGGLSYTELPGVGHNDIFDVAPHAITAAIFAARERDPNQP